MPLGTKPSKMDKTDGEQNMNIPLPDDCLPSLPSDELPVVPNETPCDTTQITSPTKPTVESPNTDNLLSLNINPIIKTPVLGTQQAKRRLLAFCQSKLPRPPRIKKPKKPTENQLENSSPSQNPDGNSKNVEDETKTEEKLPAKKSKKGPNSVEKAKAVIEEIEQIKKAENDFIEAVNRGLFNSPKLTKRSKTRSRSRERKYKRSKYRSSDSHSKHTSSENIKYPTSWTEIIKNNYDYDKIKQIRLQMNKNEHLCYDYRKQLLFEAPAVPLNSLKYRGINGEEKVVEFQKVRFTKSQPSVSYSDNMQDNTSNFTRKQILNYIPRSFRTTLEKFCDNHNVTLYTGEPTNSKTRSWYPKELNLDERETTITAPLVSYSDPDENFEETEQVPEKEVAPEKEQRDSDEERTPPKKVKEKKKKTTKKAEEKTSKSAKSKRKSRKLKKKVRKLKTKEKIKRRKDKSDKKSKREENDESGIDENKATNKCTAAEKCDSDQDNKTEKKQHKTTSNTKNKKRTETVEKNKRSESTKTKTESEVPKKDGDAPRKSDHHHKDKGVARQKRSKSKEIATKHDTSTPKSNKPATADANEKEKSPDTDDYHSHWESEDDVISQERLSKHNRSWESDEDTFERSSCWNPTKKEYLKSPERSLEMPLNICKPFRRDAKLLPEGIMLQVNNVINTVTAPKNFDIEPLSGEKPTILEATSGDFNASLKETTEEVLENKSVGKKRKKCRWGSEEDISTKLPLGDGSIGNSLPEHFDSVENKAESNGEEAETSITSSQPNVLENEYEEFMKSLTSDTSKDENTTKKRKVRSSSSSSSSDSDSSTDSTTSSSSSDSSSSEDTKKKKPKVDVIDEFAKSDLDILPKDVALSTSLIGFTDVPLPVPSPSEKAVPLIPLQIPVALNITKIQDESGKVLEFDRTKPLNLSSLSLPDKKLLKKSVLEDADSNNSEEEEDKYEDDKSTGQTKGVLSNEKSSEDLSRKNEGLRSDCTKKDEPSGKSKRNDSPPKSRRSDSSQKRRDSQSQRRRDRDASPGRRDISPRRRDASPPRRRDASPRRRSSPKRSRRRDSSHPSQKRRGDSLERRRDLSPKRRELSPKRREQSPRRSRRHELSPRRRDSPPRRRDSVQKRKRSASPYRNMSPRGDISPKRFDISSRRSTSPRQKRRHSPSVDINRSSKSPINSPLDGFKRSVADSTISDDLLPQHNVNDYLDSPIYSSQYYRGAPITQSPKRISLDDRINQVLGIEKEPPKPIGTTYDQANYNPQYYQQYEHYNYMHPGAPMYQECKYEMPRATSSHQGPVNKVVQVGNVLHVMPAENIPPTANAPKIVQVGNVLEIVPTATIEIQPQLPQSKEMTSAEDLMKQKNAERRAEHEKRRQARELRRKEKERKRKEKEKRKQMKIKLKTENMIKRALLLESMDDEDNENKNGEEVSTAQWPPVPIIITNTALKPAGKGILISHGFSENKTDSSDVVKKSVKFADGVNPGEGTSPSGGEELSSPPPPKATLPKEKRYKKTKISKKIKPKKKKIKVKIIRKIHDDGDDSEEDNLPPPSPPPGSPPPHIFPPRIKTHTINNVHLNYVNTVINASMAPPPPPSSTVHSAAYRPVMPVMMTAPLPHGHITNAHHLQTSHGHMHPPMPQPMAIPHRLPGKTPGNPQKQSKNTTFQGPHIV